MIVARMATSRRARRGRPSVTAEKGWREPDRVDDDKQRHKRRYGEVERHSSSI
jgi:hypothetical protein